MRITKYLIGGLAALALVGCKDKMRELNTNPNTIGETEPQYMFLNALSDFDNPGRGFTAANAQTVGAQMQYFVYYTGAQDSRYCDEQAMSYPSLGTVGYHYDWWKSVGYKVVSLQNYITDNLTAEQALKYQDMYAMCGIIKVYDAFRIFKNYGANVYNEAFKAITEGITLPKYDIFDNAMYEQLDDELAGYIATLEAPANEGTIELGIYDPIYGYKLPAGAPIMGAPTDRGDYTQQRALWKKFANSFRLYMAWIMKDVDAERFNKVFAETKASGWYENADEGAFTYMNGSNENSGLYNCAEAADISTLYTVSDNFISYLKENEDPRLPLLARANNLFEANKNLQWIKAYFPDSLTHHWYYNRTTKEWEYREWGKVLDFETYPEMAYQGVSANPNDYDKGGPQQFWGTMSFTFQFYHPNYKPGDTEGNKTLGKWKVTNQGVPSEDFPAEYTITNPDTSFTIEVGSRPQGRYYVPSGGSQYGAYDGQSRNGFDGTVDDRSSIYMRYPIYTYPEFCFLMAYLTLNDGLDTGKSADEWYAAGVTAAMEELQGNAIRYGVQVATNKEHTHYTEATGTRFINPEIVGINDGDVYSITDKIASYVTAHPLSSATDQLEAIVGQMWIYAYNEPTKMWDWWRKTDYPKIKEVKSPAERPTGLYWVKPTTQGDGNELTWPRRGALPQPEAANNVNYNAARNTLLDVPGYGAAYDENIGSIYWDTKGINK